MSIETNGPKDDSHPSEPLKDDSVPGKPEPSATSATPSVPSYSISPRRVAMFATAIAAASLTGLTVVASVEGAEALSTIALVLAIVAFTIQVLLFVVQSQSASEQRVRTEQLNTQTRALLAEVQTTAQGTQAMVSQQFNQLLQAFVTGAAQTAQETKFDPATFEQRLLSNIRAAAQPSTSTNDPQTSPTPNETPPQRATAGAQRARVPSVRARQLRPLRLKSFPPEDEGRQAADALRKLSPDAQRRLQRLAEDELESTKSGTYVGLLPDPIDKELDDRRMATSARVSGPDGPQIVTRLTDTGVAVARLLTALGDIPPWARDVVDLTNSDRTGSLDDDIPF